MLRLLLAGLLLLGPVSCGRAASAYDRIMASGSPIIGDAWYSEGPAGKRPEVSVAFLPGTTVEQAEQFWCDVVVPAGGTHDFSGVHVELAIQGGPLNVAADTTCGQP